MGSKHGKLTLPKKTEPRGEPITSFALFQFMWMLLSGTLLPERGALFPALKTIGLSLNNFIKSKKTYQWN